MSPRCRRSARARLYDFETAKVILVGGSPAHPPVTPGLVQVSALPPAAPETVSEPLQVVPVTLFMMVTVNVPENVVAVVVPLTLPVFGAVPFVVCQVPDTALPVCVKDIVTVCVAGPAARENDIVPVQTPATLAGEGVDGELQAANPLTEATAASMPRKRRMSNS